MAANAPLPHGLPIEVLEQIFVLGCLSSQATAVSILRVSHWAHRISVPLLYSAPIISNAQSFERFRAAIKKFGRGMDLRGIWLPPVSDDVAADDQMWIYEKHHSVFHIALSPESLVHKPLLMLPNSHGSVRVTIVGEIDWDVWDAYKDGEQYPDPEHPSRSSLIQSNMAGYKHKVTHVHLLTTQPMRSVVLELMQHWTQLRHVALSIFPHTFRELQEDYSICISYLLRSCYVVLVLYDFEREDDLTSFHVWRAILPHRLRRFSVVHAKSANTERDWKYNVWGDGIWGISDALQTVSLQRSSSSEDSS